MAKATTPTIEPTQIGKYAIQGVLGKGAMGDGVGADRHALVR